MGSRRTSKFRATLHLLAPFLAVVVLPLPVSTASAAVDVIYSFEEEYGEYAATNLEVDSAGNIYGTTTEGGEFGGGTVFQLLPGPGGFTEVVLHSFTGGKDGGQPYNGVTLDGAGNLYGTAVIGGPGGGACPEDGCGVVYKLSNNGGVFTHEVIYNFKGGDDGYGPGAGVALDANGAIYGMTPTGGSYGMGIIYQLSPAPNGKYNKRTIHTFTGGIDGGTGSAGRLLLSDTGSFFGVATVGGAYGAGIVFELVPAGSKWKLNTLYSFKGDPDAGFPYGALVRDASGNLYGTTYYSGAAGLGTVYQLTYRNGGYRESVIHNFKGGTDGQNPISHLVMDGTGNLYGTTSEGGAAGCSCGTIFRLSPAAGGKWVTSVVHSFSGTPDGAYPYNGMTMDPTGTVLYGATVHGGEDNEGSIFQYTP